MKKSKNNNKKRKVILFSILSIVFILVITCVIMLLFNINRKDGLSIEWIEIEGTAVGQSRIYIKDSNGKYVDGLLEMTTISGTVFEENVTSSGSDNLYVKSVIKSVKIK